MVNTKDAPRRSVSFLSLDDLKADLDRLDAASAAGGLGKTGNWSPAENLDHLAKFWNCSLDGFPPGKPPLIMRVMCQLLLKKKATTLGNQSPPGFKIPKGVSHFAPSGDATYEQSAEALRTCIARVERGDSYVPASPLFGNVTGEQWTNMHLGHCAMHMSFISVDSGNADS